MFYLCCLLKLIILYAVCDVNYFVRTFISVFFGHLFYSAATLKDSTEFYSIGTFRDCSIKFKTVRLARLLRELDFARFEYYCRTGIFTRTRKLYVHSLQGSTLVVHFSTLPLFVPYKLTCKLVYWDERSLFIEHELTTLNDTQIRGLFVSRQYAVSDCGVSTEKLLHGLPGSDKKPECPKYIEEWLKSMKISSENLRR